MQVALVISLVTLFLVAATVTVAVQDRRTQHREAKRRHSRLARLGEPVPRLTAHSTARPHRSIGG